MPAITSVSPSGNQDIDGLLYSYKWAVNSFTFSFPTSGSFYEPGSAPWGETTTNFGALNATQQNFVRNYALTQFAAVANVTFTEITETATTHADLRFAKTDATDTAWGYYPASQGFGGDTWYRNSGGYFDDPVIGNYAAHAFLHEIGHAFGLEHGHDSSNPFGNVPTAHNSVEYTIMTYRTYVGGPADGYTYGNASAPQTLMQNDIAALQYLYGANYNTNSGNTVYSWNPTTGQTFINGASMGAVAGNKIFMTLWDGNGIDTYDLSAYSTNLTIDLQPGAWSTFSTTQRASLGSGQSAAGNVANALLHNNNTQSLIENAIGGSGNDTIIGNAANNTLIGGAGNDTFVYSTGADTITDFVAGAGGIDVIDLRGVAGIQSLADVLARTTQVGANTVIDFGSGNTIMLQNLTMTNLVSGDFLFSAPVLQPDLTASGLVLNGTSVSYTINNTGTATASTSSAGIYLSADSTITSADTLLASVVTAALAAGGTVAQGATLTFPTNLNPGTYYVGVLADRASQIGENNENNNVSNLLALILGNTGSNALTGTAANDTMFGMSGDDSLDGGAGNDWMWGGNGNDVYFVDSIGDAALENAAEGIDFVYSSVNYTLSENIENIALLGSANLTAVGNSGNNVIYSNSGVNTLEGKTGDDIYFVYNASDAVIEQPGQGEDIVYANVTYTMPINVEILVLMGSANLNATGGTANDIIYSNSGINTLSGGNGNDSYIVHNSSDTVVEQPGQGTDIVYAYTNYTMPNNVEVLVLMGSENLNASGSIGNDIIYSNSGVNTLAGGNGNDNYVVHNTLDKVTEQSNQGADIVYSYVNYTIPVNVEVLVLVGSSNITATGGAGNDVIYGNNGASTLAGKNGNDTYVIRNSLTQVTELSGQGIDTVNSDVSFALPNNIENLVLLGTANLTGTGNSSANVFYGNNGNNVFSGNGGNDIFVFNPSFGNDTIVDFDVNSEYIAFNSSLFSDYLSVLSHTADNAQGNAVISYDSNNSLTLLGVNKASLEGHYGAFWFI